jgi:putative ABC transport system permease protein
MRFALRTLRHNPGFALTTIVTLALGIGVTTAIFSVVNAVLLRPLPYRDPERLVILWSDMRARNVLDFPLAPGDFPDIRAQGTLLEDFAGVATGRQTVINDNAAPEQVRAAFATSNVFSVLGLEFSVGRGFVASDGAPNPQPPQPVPGAAAPAQPAGPPARRLPTIAVLSHGFWERRFGGDSGVVGKTIELGGGPATVVGVLAPGAELLFPPSAGLERVPDVWVALRIDFASASRINVFLRTIGRLKKGVTVEQANAQMEKVAADLRERFPVKKGADLHFRVEPMQKNIVSGVRTAIIALMGAVTFVLLIACANVANLLLVRASARERELAVRSALGSSPWRLIRQLLAESLLLSGLGAAVGLILAQFGIQALLAIAPNNLPRVDQVDIDFRVLAFTIAVSIVAAVTFGLVPAIRASRPNVADVLRAGGRSPSLLGAGRLRNGVVIAEVALSFVLLIGSGLMVRSFIAIQRIDAGFEPNGLLTVRLGLPPLRSPQEAQAFVARLGERLRGLPGVRGVTAVSPLPLDWQENNAKWGHANAANDPSAFQQADVEVIQPGYFDVMRTRFIGGREFSAAENAPEGKVVVLDDILAAKAFPGQSAIGKSLLVRVRTNEPEWIQVIGVVHNQRHSTLSGDERGVMFYPDGMFGFGNTDRWVLRTSGDPVSLGPSVRAALTQFNSQISIADVQPMRTYVDRAMGPTRFALSLIGIFAAIAAALAAVGLYGVLSSAVRQRTAEIGVRMAFGAPANSIFRLIIGHGLRLSGVGILLGVVGALALTGVMRSLLIGVTPTDPITFASIAIFFVVIATVACWIPARRAAGMDPNVALREE